MGMMELGNTFSFIQLVLDDIVVNDIKKMFRVGPDMKKTGDLTKLTDLKGKGFSPVSGFLRRGWPAMFPGPGGGTHPVKRDVIMEARQKVQAILNNYKPEPLPTAVSRKIREIILEAEEKEVRESERRLK